MARAREEDIRKMMWCIGYKRKNPNSSAEIDTLENKYGRRSKK